MIRFTGATSKYDVASDMKIVVAIDKINFSVKKIIDKIKQKI